MMLDDSLEIVTTPTSDWLSEKAKICRSRMILGSPYVNDGIFKLTDLVPNEASRTLVTRTDLRDFAVRASSWIVYVPSPRMESTLGASASFTPKSMFLMT